MNPRAILSSKETGSRYRSRVRRSKSLGGFEVGADGVTTVILDWDADESLVLRGNGEWLLKPVIAMEVSTSQ